MQTKPLISVTLIAAAAIAGSCGGSKDTGTQAGKDAAKPTATPAQVSSISADRLMEHVRALSSDAFAGRLPGTEGEEKTVTYLVEQFKALGLEPGNPDGNYIQKVPLVGIAGTAT